MSELLNTVRDILSMVEQGVISPEEGENVLRAHALTSQLPGTRDLDFTNTLNWCKLRAFLREESTAWSPLQSKFLENVWPDGCVPNAGEVLAARATARTAVRSLNSAIQLLDKSIGCPKWLRGTAHALGAEILLETPRKG